MDQSRPYPQNYNAGYDPEPTINFSTTSVLTSINSGEQQWKHFLTNISPFTSNRLTFIVFFYILIGILSIGLDIKLLMDQAFGYFVGSVNGFHLFFIGIVTLALCRQQVYVLTSLFVLVVFQLILTLITFAANSYFFYDRYYDISPCVDIKSCYFNEIGTILIATLIHSFLTFCLIIANLIIIGHARRLPIPITSRYVVYASRTQPMPPSFQNPNATPINQSSSA